MATLSWTTASAAIGIGTMGKAKRTGAAVGDAAPAVFAGRAWQQVLARDAGADGQFVYAVKSTGIYCRPSCPSRRPERKNVSFYPNAPLAEAAGFRACLRCEPSRVTPKADPQAAAIAKATEFLAEHAGQRTSLDALAEAAGMGKFALQRGFKRVLGVTPGEFAREQRKERFRERVRRPKTTVTEAVYAAGFGSSSRLYEGVKESFGMRPSVMRAGGKGASIRFGITDSPLERMLVATTSDGVCAVAFGASDAELLAGLRERFPQARIERDDAGMQVISEDVLDHLRESPAAHSLPLDVRRTAFQERVWKAMLEIPRGETLSYKQVAEKVGSPRGMQAVGAACGANPVAVLIPCHRVVGSDGRMHGWRWGLERKEKLLAMERE